jgi:hypothetical protein
MFSQASDGRHVVSGFVSFEAVERVDDVNRPTRVQPLTAAESWVPLVGAACPAA